MRGTNYHAGLTFRNPRLSALRAEYAAALRDQGLSHTAIAWALGLHGKRRRAFQIVQHGRKLRDAALVAKIKGTMIGAVLDANAISAGEMYRYLHLATEREYRTARKLAEAELAAEATAPKLEDCVYCHAHRLCPIHGMYGYSIEMRMEDDGTPPTPYVAPDYYAPIRNAFEARESRLSDPRHPHTGETYDEWSARHNPVTRHEGAVPLPGEVTVTTLDGHTAQYVLAQEETGQ